MFREKNANQLVKGLIKSGWIDIDAESGEYRLHDWDIWQIHMESEAKLYIQAGIRAGKYSLDWSYVLNIENDRTHLKKSETQSRRGKNCGRILPARR